MIIAVTTPTNSLPFPYKRELDKLIDPMGEPEKPFGTVHGGCQPIRPQTDIIIVKEQGKINYLA